ncbi:ankyrin repeat-containing protein [Cavenderia fasciculata]|uniref:Ankyrin repeat-containing protein n=1 Tax=Cavenderia fasciculata TaxID=261658 RepID=F4Q8I5_CACFS|nr:ankyrin repeat-containing protein [Cavenderia fasciculata]EGG16085.1 ankyrin repeat-containing protein [Cavenderia fasciculata]|eukprot:XP_004352410.1 ankyrin repeat-containing protein [Cavenderia fasciculata]
MSSSATTAVSPVLMETTTSQMGNLSLMGNSGVPLGDIRQQPPLVIESFKIMDIFSQLYNAKDFNSIDTLLNTGRVSVNSQNQQGLSLLQLAVSDNNMVYVQYLLFKGANPNITDINQSTPLHTASSMGNINMQQLLLQAGAIVDVQDQEGETPSYYSVREQKHASLLLLIKNGANVNATNEDSETLLHLASQLGDLSSVQILVQSGANLKLVDSDGVTAIQEAKDNGHNQVADYLLQCVRNSGFVGDSQQQQQQFPFKSYNDLHFGTNNNINQSYFNNQQTNKV